MDQPLPGFGHAFRFTALKSAFIITGVSTGTAATAAGAAAAVKCCLTVKSAYIND